MRTITNTTAQHMSMSNTNTANTDKAYTVNRANTNDDTMNKASSIMATTENDIMKTHTITNTHAHIREPIHTK